MTRKKMVLKVMRAMKAKGIKIRLPIRATLAKAHIRGNVTHDLMLKLGASYLHKTGCSCCYTGSMYDIKGQHIEIAHGRLWEIPLGFTAV